jgi:hypothetical protein
VVLLSGVLPGRDSLHGAWVWAVQQVAVSLAYPERTQSPFFLRQQRFAYMPDVWSYLSAYTDTDFLTKLQEILTPPLTRFSPLPSGERAWG